MATLPTYYLRLSDGSSVTLKNVTATPTLVDPTGAPIMDGWYRDGDPPDFGGVFLLPGKIATQIDETTGAVTVSDLTTAGVNGWLTDAEAHIAPRQLSYKLSYWEFLVAPDPAVPATTVGYYVRWDRLDAMATDPISSF